MGLGSGKRNRPLNQARFAMITPRVVIRHDIADLS